MLVTPTPDLGKVLSAMQEMKIEGRVNLATAVQIAQLALKHRENKNQRQRIVVFVGSPIVEDERTLVKIAKKLKKNNVAVDIVSFGSEEENAGRLEAFHGAVNSNDNSHLVTVPPGTILSDMLFGTPIFMEEGAGGGEEGEGGAAAPRSNIVDGFDYGALGVDPNLDPELALALRLSMEEERARQNAAAAEGASNPETKNLTRAEEPGGQAGPSTGNTVEAMDEDALLQQALAMSMGGDATAEAATPVGTTPPSMTPAAPAKEQEAGNNDAEMEEMDPELALALQMSMAQEQPGDEKDQETKDDAAQ